MEKLLHPNSSLSSVLVKEALKKKPKILLEWNSLHTKYDIDLNSIDLSPEEDAKTDIKFKIQRVWTEKDLQEMKKSQQAKITSFILKTKNNTPSSLSGITNIG